MTLRSTACVAVLAAALLLPGMALSDGALGQNQTPADSPSAAVTPKAHAAVSATERVERHITQLHARLHITAEQQTGWDQFAQVMRDNAKNMDQLLQQRAVSFASMNAVEDMQSYAQVAQQHAQDTQKLAAAFQALYGSLSDEQKKNADVVFHAHGDHPTHGKA
jgi:protein CpxP